MQSRPGGGAFTGDKNLANLATAISAIKLKPPYDPENPQLSDIKAVLNSDDPASIYPIGTTIPDTYNGHSNPLIVAQYLDSTNNSSYGGAEGVILIRKYSERLLTYPAGNSYAWGSNNTYRTSWIKTFLDSTYMDKCSEQIKAIISGIELPGSNNLGQGYVLTSKWFLPSSIEFGFKHNTIEGFFWDYWKQKTGWSEANGGANSGRIITRLDTGDADVYYTRTPGSGTAYVQVGLANGSLNQTASTNSNVAFVPACFISKN